MSRTWESYSARLHQEVRHVGKKFEAAKKQVPPHPLTIEDAIPLLQKVKYAKFDETVELTARLGVDPVAHRELRWIARAEYAARVAGAAWAELRRAR